MAKWPQHRVTLNNASVYQTNGLYRTINLHRNPRPLVSK